jgi:hypothetical protein
MIVGLVGMDLGRPTSPPPAGHQDRWDVVQHRLQQGGIVGIGRAHHHRDRQPTTVAGHMQLGAGLAPIDRGLRRSGPPFDRPQAEAVDADALQVDAAGRPELVQQQRLELVEHPGLGPLIQPPLQPPPAGRG